MGLFQCEECGCAESTATSLRAFQISIERMDWSYAPERKGKKLCSVCGPTHYKSGEENTIGGKWHNRFPRYFLPKGEFHTNHVGNLEHIETGREDYYNFALNPPQEKKDGTAGKSGKSPRSILG